MFKDLFLSFMPYKLIEFSCMGTGKILYIVCSFKVQKIFNLLSAQICSQRRFRCRARVCTFGAFELFQSVAPRI